MIGTMLATLVLAGCTGGDQVAQRVTSIPADAPMATATATSEPAATEPVLPAASPAAATPLPLATDLPLGSAMQIAAATDAAYRPTPRNPVPLADSPALIRFGEFYDGYNMRTGLVLSDKLVALDGQQVVMEGYMAPPLKPELDYFVLTRIRLAFCPFCSTAADWPDDIALVYLPADTTNATEYPVRVTGRLEVGASVDQETGMVSLVRIYADSLELIE